MQAKHQPSSVTKWQKLVSLVRLFQICREGLPGKSGKNCS